MQTQRYSRRETLRLAAGSVSAVVIQGLPSPQLISKPGKPRGNTTDRVPAISDLYRALDTDFGANGVQPQWWFDAARAEGYDGFITTLHTFWNGVPAHWDSSHAVLERALAAGMWIGAYGRPASHWREALGPLPRELREQLKFYSLDIEIEPGGTQFPMRREYADGVANEFGVRPIVYTGWGMWGDVMGYTAGGFSDLPLWDFSGDLAGWPTNVADPELVAFGGWNAAASMRVGRQVQMLAPATLNGVAIDRDIFTRSFIDGGAI